MVLFVCFFYVFQIVEIKKLRKENNSKQLVYLQYVTAIELIFALSRIATIITNNFGIKQFEQLPQMLIIATLAQLVMNTLSYISVAGYWAEKISFLNAKNIAENEVNEKKVIEISGLLKEKEQLVFSLLKANKTATTGALSASIAHELNQPLTSSTLNIHLLRKALNSEPIQIDVCKKIIGTLENDAQRAATIIKSLRSIFTDDDANIEFIEVIKILPTVLEVIKKEVDEENIHIDLKIDKNLKVQFNPTEFQQVLLNLFSNSIHALSNSNNDPKKITLEASKIASKIRITITDNGNGITKEFQPNLFELLSTTKQTGMGLGLWLCKHIINRQNGNIWYEENEMGAKFVIEL
ncbi:MAG: sensor histidine kinase, partial [Chitinophagia bacterium]|nr:sensor histidine kinase [Chitinophagia bacterium]